MPRYLVSSADFGVKTANSVRYPDVMVDGAKSDRQDLAAAKPLLVAEVLSPSTMPIDFGEKAEEYKTIATLKHYLVLAQDEPRAWLWFRNAEGNWSEPEMIAGDTETVPLPGLGLNLPMAGLYAGIIPASE